MLVQVQQANGRGNWRMRWQIIWGCWAIWLILKLNGMTLFFYRRIEQRPDADHLWLEERLADMRERLMVTWASLTALEIALKALKLRRLSRKK